VNALMVLDTAGFSSQQTPYRLLSLLVKM